MIALFTDFGWDGPYVGQMHAVLAHRAPGVTVIDLQHDAPRFDPRASAYLLAALLDSLPPGTIVVGVVDPGVGTERAPVAVDTGRHWLIGPDNGLFAVAAARSGRALWHRLTVSEPLRSATFHGRDLFAPAAAALALHGALDTSPLANEPVGADWPDELAEVVYVDAFGNAWTGLRNLPEGGVRAAGVHFRPARTFGEVPPGTPICHLNSSGLLELAINCGSAAARCALSPGEPVEPLAGP